MVVSGGVTIKTPRLESENEISLSWPNHIGDRLNASTLYNVFNPTNAVTILQFTEDVSM